MSAMIKKPCNLGFSQPSFIELAISLGDVWIWNECKVTWTRDFMAGFGWVSKCSYVSVSLLPSIGTEWAVPFGAFRPSLTFWFKWENPSLLKWKGLTPTAGSVEGKQLLLRRSTRTCKGEHGRPSVYGRARPYLWPEAVSVSSSPSPFPLDSLLMLHATSLCLTGCPPWQAAFPQQS